MKKIEIKEEIIKLICQLNHSDRNVELIREKINALIEEYKKTKE